MKLKHNLLYSVLFVLFTFSLTTYYACTKNDPCENVSCVNGGVCNNGTCTCPDGYKGTFCEIKKDPCEDVVCQNGGVCVAGSCSCPEGFYGEQCEKAFSTSILGSYMCTETCDPPVGNSTWESKVTILSGDKTRVSISNFGGSSFSVTGKVSVGKIILDATKIGSYDIQGNGTFANNKITITYRTLAQNGFTCTMEMVLK